MIEAKRRYLLQQIFKHIAMKEGFDADDSSMWYNVTESDVLKYNVCVTIQPTNQQFNPPTN